LIVVILRMCKLFKLVKQYLIGSKLAKPQCIITKVE